MSRLVLLLTLLVVLIAPAAARAADPAVRWQLDEGIADGTIADSSGNGHVGTAQGLKPEADGRFSGAERIKLDDPPDGTGVISASSPALEQSSMSVVFWVRGPGASDGPIISYGTPTCSLNACDICQPAAWTIAPDFGGSKELRAEVHLDGAAVSVTFGAPGTLSGAWHAVAVTYDGTTLRSYVDGQPDATAAGGGPIRYESAAHRGLTLGAPRPGAGCGQDNGGVGVDDARLYTTALTAAEAKYLTSPWTLRPPVLPAPDPEPHQDLAVRYHLDHLTDGLRATDSSGHGLHASDGNVVSEVPGRFGGAVAFPGSSRLLVESNVAPLEPDQLTLLAWVKRGTAPNGATIIGKGAKDDCTSAFALTTTNTGTVRFALTGASADEAQQQLFTTPAAAAGTVWDGGWHAIAGVYDGTQITLWRDGTKIGSTAIPANRRHIPYGAFAPRDLSFGQARSDCSSTYYDGALDEVSLYDRALTDAEVGTLQAADATSPPRLPGDPPAPEPEPDLVAKWHLDGPDGAGRLPDASGNDIDATIDAAVPVGTARFRGGYQIQSPAPGARAGFGAVDPRLDPGALTVLAWVRRGDLSRGGVIASNGASCTDPSYGLRMSASGDVVFSADTGPDISHSTPSAAITDQQWHAIAGTFDGEYVRLFVDGVLVGSPQPTGGTHPYGAGHRLQIGDAGAGGCAFAGDVDEVRLYKNALSANQLAYLSAGYHRTPPTLPEPAGPRNTTAPSFSALPKIGETATCDPGQWTGSPTFTYLWERAPRATTAPGDQAWVAIDGAADQTFTITQNEDGLRLRCRVIAANGAGTREAVSASKRVDAGVPAPVAGTPPTISGLPAIAGHALTCDPGSWTGNPDFAFTWVRRSDLKVMSREQTYTPKKYVLSQFYRQYDTENGSTNDDLRCFVTGTNDVGRGTQEAASDYAFAIQDKPVPRTPASITLSNDANPLQQVATCHEGEFFDDYYAHRDTAPPGYGYTYQWYRRDANGAEAAPIPGATRDTFTLTADVLGRSIACGVTASNVLGSAEGRSGDTFIPLPAGSATEPGRINTAFRNENDPVNMLATSTRYREATAALYQQRLHSAAAALKAACPKESLADVAQTYRRKPSSLDPTSITQLKLICYLLETDDATHDLAYRDTGLAWTQGGGSCPASGEHCSPVLLPVQPVSAATAKGLEPDLQAKLAGITPVRVLWDIDGDNRTDISCPGTSPVVRMELNRGLYHPQAIIVSRDSATTGVFTRAVTVYGSNNFTFPDTSARTPGAFRKPQPLWCRSSITPPPDPETAPCTTMGSVGQVALRGDLCPINVRGVPQSQLDALPPEIKAVAKAAADEINAREAAQEKLLDGYSPGTRSLLGERAVRSSADGDLAATAQNTISALSGVDGGAVRSNLESALLDRMTDLAKANTPSLPKGSIDPEKGEFALDQIYAVKGALNLNGVTIDPKGNLPTIVAPSDVTQALPTAVHKLTVSAPQAVMKLGDKPLADGEKALRTEIDDAVGGAAKTIKDNIDLDAIDPSKFDLGPFKLVGSNAKVTVNPDQTVTLHATAKLPGLTLSAPGQNKTDITLGVDIHADSSGKFQLQGFKLDVGEAFIFGIHLLHFNLTYADGALSAHGQIKFDFLAGAGINIVRFGIDSNGNLTALQIDYQAGAGQGIPVGSGVFLDKVGGGFATDKKTDLLEIYGDAGFSLLAPSATEGCPTVGVDGRLTVHVSPWPFTLDANATTSLLCIPLAKTHAYVSSKGIAGITTSFSLDVPAIVTISGGVGGQIQTDPNLWQVDATGAVDFKFLPFKVKLKGVLGSKGMAACGEATIPTPWPFKDLNLAAGAAVRFIGGIPPLTLPQLILGFRAFTGCDLGAYTPIHAIRIGRDSAAPQTFPLGTDPVAVSLEGAGAAPSVTLVSPSGKRLDYTTGAEHGKFLDDTFGAVLPTEDRTVIMIHHPERGMWKAEVADGSAPIVRIQSAPVLASAKVTARVTGRGSARVLHYRVRRIPGQVVDLLETADNGHKPLAHVVGGGTGTVRYTVDETRSPKRTIEAEVAQDGMPRQRLEVAHYVAPNPKVGKPRVRVRRAGAKAIVTWSKAALAARYNVIVTYAGRGAKLFTTGAKSRTVTVPAVGKRGGLRVTVTAYSTSGRHGRPGRGRLAVVRHKRRRHRHKR